MIANSISLKSSYLQIGQFPAIARLLTSDGGGRHPDALDLVDLVD
jgi:hypothetical protein